MNVDNNHGRKWIRAVIRSYKSPVVRVYCAIRFVILRQRFLDEIGQYLPKHGRALDIGCGFGLFSLYFAGMRPSLHLEGRDLNTRRIATANKAANQLSIKNVEYKEGDATQLALDDRYDAVYMLDVLHHISTESAYPLLEEIHGALNHGGVLLVKEVERDPLWKMAFTYLLDLLMDVRGNFHYWNRCHLQKTIEDAGFVVKHHSMVDYLPYPHILYVCTKH